MPCRSRAASTITPRTGTSPTGIPTNPSEALLPSTMERTGPREDPVFLPASGGRPVLPDQYLTPKRGFETVKTGSGRGIHRLETFAHMASTLSDQVNTGIAEAMKAKDTVRLSALRMLK